MAGARWAIAGVAVTLAAALVLFLALRGSGGTHPPAAAGRGAAGLGEMPPSPATGSGQAVPARHADPLSGAAASYAADRSGSVLAAVYDVSTGQSWRLGDGPPQAEASVVKLDILEALLAQQAGTALSAGRPVAVPVDDRGQRQRRRHQPVGRGRRGDGHRGLQRQRRALRDDPFGVRDVRRVRLAGLGPDDHGPAGPAQPAAAAHRARARARCCPTPQRSYALSLMENVAPGQRWGVTGGVPAGVRVALKNGWLPLNDANTDWQINSVGWVSGDGPRLPDRRAHHGQPDRAVRHRHDQRPFLAHLDGDALAARRPPPAPMSVRRR